MATDATSQLMTTKEFLQLADKEGVTRELIDGVLEERPVTTRSPKHSKTMAELSRVLGNWLNEDANGNGIVACGEVRCRMATDPDLIVGVDVVFYEGEEAIKQADEQSYFDGPPCIAIEVLSPTDTHEGVVDKINRYISNGSRQVWIADPDLRTVTIYRPDADATFFNAGQELTAEPELPGFRVAVKELFLRK